MNRRLLAGVALSAVLLALLAAQVDLADVLEAYGAAAPGWLALTLGLHLSVLSLKAGRWRVVLGAVPHPAPPEAPRPADRWLVFDALFLGYFGNYVLPAKLGELGRSALYSQRSGLPLSSTLATILFERLVDALLLVGLFYLTLIALPLPEALPEWMRSSARAAGLGALLGTLGALWFALRAPREEERDEAAAAGLTAKLQDVMRQLRGGLTVLRRPAVVAQVVAWTLLIWGVEAASIRACLEAFGHSLSWAGAVVQMVISSFAIAAPSAPGGLGVHQWVSVLVLALWGVGRADAIAASLVMTFAVVAWVVPLGLFGLWRQGVSTASLRAASEGGP